MARTSAKPRCHRSAVDENGRCLAHPYFGEQGLAWVVWGAEALGNVQLTIVDDDKIGERATGIDAHAVHVCSLYVHVHITTSMRW